MCLWLRFAVVNLEDIQRGGTVKPLRIIELDSDRQSFITTVYPLYQDLTPLAGTPVPSSFQLESTGSHMGTWSDGGHVEPFTYYTREELLRALEMSLEYGYTKNEDDQDLWHTVDTLPEGKVLIKILM